MNNNDDVDVSGSKYDVEDRACYDYLKPIWEVLENVPEQGITSDELWKQSKLDKEHGNKLIKQLQNEFQNNVLNNITGLFLNKKEIVNSWAFDKIMLLVTKINTNSGVQLPDNMVFNMWKKEWRKKRGI